MPKSGNLMGDGSSREVFAYVGNWRIDGTGLGITICRYDSTSGALEPRRTVAPGISVGATHVDAERGILYCADERSDNPDLGPGGGGRVFAFRIDPVTGELTEMGRQSAYASLTSYVTTDAAREYLLATNHARFTRITTAVRDAEGTYRVVPLADPATTVLYRLEADGSIGEVRDIHTHVGEGPAPRFHTPAAHCVVPSPDGRSFAVCDKGTDEVLMFQIDRRRDALVLTGRSRESDNTSPRYVQFHPTAPYLYVNHENAPFVTVFRYDRDGGLERVAEVDALPADDTFARDIAEQADLLINASGNRLYGLIRRTNAVSVFDVDAATGALRRIQTLQLDGDNPRGGAISPDGRFLLVAQIGTEDVATLAIDDVGRLRDTGMRSTFTRPGNIAFFTA